MPGKSRQRKSRSRKKQPSTFSLRRATSSSNVKRVKRSKPASSMSLTELQDMAMSRGIPFGGLSKHQLIEKIQKYH